MSTLPVSPARALPGGAALTALFLSSKNEKAQQTAANLFDQAGIQGQGVRFSWVVHCRYHIIKQGRTAL